MYLSMLTRREKELFLDFAYILCVADGEFGESEKQVLNSYYAEMQFETLTARKETQVETIIGEMASICDEQSRKIILFELLGLALADNKYDEKEKGLLYSTAEQFQLSVSFVEACKAAIQEYITLQTKLNKLIIA